MAKGRELLLSLFYTLGNWAMVNWAMGFKQLPSGDTVAKGADAFTVSTRPSSCLPSMLRLRSDIHICIHIHNSENVESRAQKRPMRLCQTRKLLPAQPGSSRLEQEKMLVRENPDERLRCKICKGCRDPNSKATWLKQTKPVNRHIPKEII